MAKVHSIAKKGRSILFKVDLYMDGYELRRELWPTLDEDTDDSQDSGSEEDSLIAGIPPEDKEKYPILMDVFSSIGDCELILTSKEKIVKVKDILDIANVEKFKDDEAYRRPFRITTWYHRFGVHLETKAVMRTWDTKIISKSSSSSIYDPRSHMQHFCSCCEQWFNTENLEPFPGEGTNLQVPALPHDFEFSPDCTDDERLKKLASAPIVRGIQYPDVWRIVGNGLMVRQIRRWAKGEEQVPRWQALKRELGKLMVRSDDLDTAAHTAKRHLELGKDYTDYILKVDNHGQLLQTMQCPICEGAI
ncbi:hypothetical protein VKT23_013982 [Stygiomarasmius scandens]|uniref:Uncharacterized protein n=1 Tax=Marasmiellus scandens TaxID=2682957 RepID=A0ABR1J1L5_9AGAR